MNWRKWNRWAHRKLGYLFFGMAIIYGLSGIALNHHITKHWNPSLVEKYESIEGIPSSTRNEVDKAYIQQILAKTGEEENYKEYYFPGEKSLMIYLIKGHISVDLESGEAYLVKIRNRRIFREVNFLHYNKPKKLWTYFSDLFAFAMIVLAISGLFMMKGKKGIRGWGGLLFATGILIPLLFLFIYLWT
ncbi:PepSY-associated TM helix domain-containing protein [Bacteroidota bacterium]